MYLESGALNPCPDRIKYFRKVASGRQGGLVRVRDADLRGERPGAPVGGRKALKSFKSG